MPRYPYYEDDDRDDINIEFRRGGRADPGYIRPGMGSRPYTDSNVRLHANVNTYHRESSRDRRDNYRPISPPAAAPPVNIYNYNVDEDYRGGRQPAPVQVMPTMQMPGAFMPAVPAAPPVAAALRPTEINLKVDAGRGGRSRSRSRRRKSRSRSRSSSYDRSRSRDREREYRRRKEKEERERRYYEEERVRREREKEEERLGRLYDRERRDSRDKYMTKEEYEHELARRELESLRKKMRDLEREGRKEERKEEKGKGYMTKEEYELERTRKELAAIKLDQQKEEEKKLIKKELELKELKEKKEREEEEERKKRAAAEAVKEHLEKERKKKEDAERRENEYQQRLREQLKDSGMDDEQIEKVIKKEKLTVKKVEQKRPTYTRMARRWLSFETLNAFRLDYTMDEDPDYILIKRWVPEHEQDQLWDHTKTVRERRSRLLTENTTTTTVLQIEDTHQRRGHRLSTGQYEFVKKKNREKSPAPALITFFAGGKR